MSKVRSDNISNRNNDGAPALTYGAEVPVGYGITGAGGINITGVAYSFSGSATGLTELEYYCKYHWCRRHCGAVNYECN